MADHKDDALILGEQRPRSRVIQLPDPEMTDNAVTSLKKLKAQQRWRKRPFQRPHSSNSFPSGEPSEDFLVKIKELKVFKKLYHDLQVPKTLWDNQELGKWVSEQKTRYNLRWMTVQERDLLQETGFIWSRDIVRSALIE